MSELAFNLNGEPFEVPGGAVGWRVRKLKPKGAPEVVYGREGTPLILAIDADMEDLRREARSEGRYRLDAVDDHNKPIAGVPGSYVCIHPNEPVATETLPVVRNALPPGPDHAVIEAMRVNSELARAVVDKIPQMLESAAVLLRAADAAGMPTRPLRPIEVVEVDDTETDETPGEAAPAKAGGVMGFVEMLLEKLAPEVVKAVLSGKLQVPGGVGALLDCRRAVPKADAVDAADTGDAHAMSTPEGGPAPGRRGPAPARSSRAPGGATAVAATTPRASAPAGATTATPMELPTIEPADLAHFTAILGALTPRERTYAQALAGELSSAELRAWISELKQLSVAEAIIKLRSVLGTDDGEAGSPGPSGTPGTTSPTSGGVS